MYKQVSINLILPKHEANDNIVNDGVRRTNVRPLFLVDTVHDKGRVQIITQLGQTSREVKSRQTTKKKIYIYIKQDFRLLGTGENANNLIWKTDTTSIVNEQNVIISLTIVIHDTFST